ncbi:MAG: hypothetical protein ACK559_33140, partial [bacterium]
MLAEVGEVDLQGPRGVLQAVVAAQQVEGDEGGAHGRDAEVFEGHAPGQQGGGDLDPVVVHRVGAAQAPDRRRGGVAGGQGGLR